MQPTRREKIAIIGGAGVLGLLAVLQFVVHPTHERISMLRRVISDKRATLAEVRERSREYGKLDAEVSQLRSMIGRPEEGRKILSGIERIRQASGVSENALSLKPTTTIIDARYQETAVEVRLDGINYTELIAFLTQLDSLNLAGGIKTLEVKHADRTRGLLTAVIQLATVTQTDHIPKR